MRKCAGVEIGMHLTIRSLILAIVMCLGIAAHAEPPNRVFEVTAENRAEFRIAAKHPLKKGRLYIDKRKRTFQIYDPRPDNMSLELPLVIVLHGGGGDAKGAARMTGFSKKAAEEGFVVVYPNGVSRLRKLRTWNAGHCCAYAMEKQIDDVAFISALIDKMIADYNIDPDRVFVTGMSNGAMMTHRIGRELGDKVTAIAPVVGAIFGDEALAPVPVSTLIIAGAEDGKVPGRGGYGDYVTREPPLDKPYAPALAQSAYWTESNGCVGTSKHHSNDVYVRTLFDTCKAGTRVAYYVVKDNGHAWPGGKPGWHRADKPTEAFDATDVIWNFFKGVSQP